MLKFDEVFVEMIGEGVGGSCQGEGGEWLLNQAENGSCTESLPILG